MKKIIVIVIGLLILGPAVSYAGSATSRWDLSIGGFVKFDGGYANKGTGADYLYAPPESIPGNENVNDEFGNMFMASGETRLNFRIKGPGVWGAKTSAFVEGDFRGSDYGSFRLRHAYMKFDWANTNLVIGQTTTPWLSLATYQVLGVSEAAMARTIRIPQIMLRTNFGKNLFATYGIVSPHAGSDPGNPRVPKGIPDSSNTLRFNYLPYFDGQLGYQSDCLGKIESWPLTLILGGFAGQDRIMKRSGAAGTSWDDDKIDAYGVAFKAFIPIIPERKENKAGALAFTGAAFMAQGSSADRYSSVTYDAYIRRSSISGDEFEAVNAQNWGGWAQLTYYLTDKVNVNAFYGTQTWKLSDAIKRDTTYLKSSFPRTFQHYITNMVYDVSPAVRMGIEYAYITTGYARDQSAGSGGSSGRMHVGRVAAWYFF